MPRFNPPLRGILAITSEAAVASPQRLLAQARSALAGGAAILQYRDKWNDGAIKARNAVQLAELCRDFAAHLMINDDPALARSAAAAGVHVGADDVDVAAARRIVGDRAIVGATCGDSLLRAQRAVEQGADYVAFGRLFPSRTKPLAPPAHLATLAGARTLPAAICAIGGITPAHVATVVEAGADLVAVVDGIFGADDIEAATRAYVAAFTAADARRRR